MQPKFYTKWPVGLADLLRACECLGITQAAEDCAAVAAFLGLQVKPVRHRIEEQIWKKELRSQRPFKKKDAAENDSLIEPSPTEIDFEIETVDSDKPKSDLPVYVKAAEPLPEDPDNNHAILSRTPLFPTQLSRGILRKHLAALLFEGEPNIEKMVEQIAVGVPLQTIPYRSLLSLRKGVHVWWDTSEAMVAYIEDQRQLVHEIKALFGRENVSVSYFDHTPQCIEIDEGQETLCSGAVFQPERPIAILSDFGIGRPRLVFYPPPTKDWLDFIETCKRFAAPVVAFLPYDPKRAPRSLKSRMRLVHWDRPRPRGLTGTCPMLERILPDVRVGKQIFRLARRNQAAVQLALALALASKIEMNLLREARLRLIPNADAGAEADLMLSELVESYNAEGMGLVPDVQAYLREELKTMPEQLEKVWSLLMAYRKRQNASYATRVEETLNYIACLTGDPTRALQNELGPVIKSLLLPDKHTEGLVYWALRVSSQLPNEMRNHPVSQDLIKAAYLRKMAVSFQLGHIVEKDQEFWSFEVSLLPKISAAVNWVKGKLIVSEKIATSMKQIELPDTHPRVLNVSFLDQDEKEFAYSFPSGGKVEIPVNSGPILLRTLDDKVNRLVARVAKQLRFHILHLSDLHFGTEKNAQQWHSNLSSDLRQELDCDRLDAIIISGDVANVASEEEYSAARIFIERICETFKVERSNLIIVPGNHDQNWALSKKGYILMDKKDLEASVREGDYIPESESIIRLKDDETYQKRFSPFSQFYRQITGVPYPLAHDKQGMIYHLKDHDLLILGLNSAWQVDHHYQARATICPDALSAALDTIRQSPDYADCLKFAVWHHPINSASEDRIPDHGFLELLAQNGFSVCFHGHLHRTTTDLFRYDHSVGGRKIEIVGAGTFGAPTKQWNPGYPLQYNLLEVTNKQITVITRCRTDIHSAWGPLAIWPQGPGQDPLPRYRIDLVHRAPKPPTEKAKPQPERNLEADIQAYGLKAQAMYENLPLMGFRTKLRVPIRIEDIYVPLRALIDLRGTGAACFADAEDAEQKLGHGSTCDDIALPEVFSRAKDLDRRGIVILGDPGSGKTTHLKRLLLWCLQQGPGEQGLPQDMVPVFLPLRELRALDQGLDTFIQGQLDKPHLGTPAGFGKRLVGRGNLLFLLDGLDEVADPDQRARVARWIDDAVQVHPSCRFVVTCRFAGYTENARLSEQFLEMHIRPLDFVQVKAFVQNWYRIVEKGVSGDAYQAQVIADEKSRKLIDLLASPEFRARRVFELTHNPLLLTNICLVHRDRGNLPHSRDRLYEECTDVLLELWRAAIGYQTKVDARSGRQVLQPAALWMHQKEGRTRATADELAPVIEPALRDAGWPHGDAKAFLRTVRDESGLLTGWDQEHYGFMHLGFQEYLAALEIQNKCLLDPEVLNDLAGRFGQSWWQEVTLLLLSLENPCLFVPFMRELVQHPGFTRYPDLVELCLDDAAEKPALPFVELLNTEPGMDSAHWKRQLAALKLVERLDNDALNGLIDQLARHPYNKIRERVGQRTAKAGQEVIIAPRGGYELVRIPGGEFLMGSPESEEGRYEGESPQHLVRVPDFYMGRYPVTNEEYGRYLAENRKAREPEYWADRKYNQPRQPVVGVSWEQARQYAQWAGLQLPSEAQWEYACRAGTRTRYHSGDTEKDLGRAGWYEKNSGEKLHPVGQKEPNGFGLYDMHGNVWEWIEDDLHDTFEGAPNDSRAWIEDPRGSIRLFRGGSWADAPRSCRAASRDGDGPDHRDDYLGFRLALIVESEETEDVEKIVANYMGEKPKNPPVEEVKSEIEKELKAGFEKQEKESIQLYRKGNEAYDNNQFKEAIAFFEAALQIVETASLYLSHGNSKLVTSDYRAAMSAYENALDMYRGSHNREGEGKTLGNLGITYRSLGHNDKARHCYEQSLAIFEEIKSPNAEIARRMLAELEDSGK